jgi:hypothetical protein
MSDDPFDFTELQRMSDELQSNLEARTRGVLPVDTIAEVAVEHWQKDGVDLYICEAPMWEEMQRIYREGILLPSMTRYFGRWNGYCKFAKLPGLIPGRDGIYTYVPVHGGITYFQEWADGSVTYGFDTGHAHSSESPIDDLGWMRLETESMARSIQIAARFERYYLNAGDSNKKKGRVLDRMGKFLPVEISGNFGVMLRLLGGEL